MTSPASRPYSRETDEAAVAPAEWQPEQDAAPGGGSEAASTGGLHATTVAIPTATRNALISEYPDGGAAALKGRRLFCQAKVMF
jgi:hypothetical protein